MDNNINKIDCQSTARNTQFVTFYEIYLLKVIIISKIIPFFSPSVYQCEIPNESMPERGQGFMHSDHYYAF